MKKVFKKVEVFVDKSIPLLVVILLGIIISELFFHDLVEPYILYLEIADGLIIGFFLVDLIFKWYRAKNIKQFIQTSWIDIIAVFPFFLIFRVLEQFIIFFEISKSVQQFQGFLHSGLELSRTGSDILKEGGLVTQEAAKAGKLARLERFMKIFRPLQRSPRLIKAFGFYEKPLHH